MIKLFLFICISSVLFSCKTKTSEQNPAKAKQLYSEGMKILDNRIHTTSNQNAIELNNKAIEKFTAAYNADTSFRDAALFASECTMYGKDYQQCIYWTTKLISLDTSQQNINFCNERLEYCKKQLHP